MSKTLTFEIFTLHKTKWNIPKNYPIFFLEPFTWMWKVTCWFLKSIEILKNLNNNFLNYSNITSWIPWIIGIFSSHYISFKIDLSCPFFVHQQHWLLVLAKIVNFNLKTQFSPIWARVALLQFKMMGFSLVTLHLFIYLFCCNSSIWVGFFFIYP